MKTKDTKKKNISRLLMKVSDAKSHKKLYVEVACVV